MQPDPEAEPVQILAIEDNVMLLRYIESSLESAGYQVTTATNGNEAFASLRDEFFDLVLLDLKLPDVDGMEILRTIRRQDEDLPVIIVSSMQEVDKKVVGFEIGCDDYITKPFHVAELIGRVRRLLRRTDRSAIVRDVEGRSAVQDRIEVGPFILDLREFLVYKNGTPLPMRKKLFDIFLHFARHPNMVMTKEMLHERAWDFREALNKNSLYVHIHQLRNLVEDDPAHPVYLKTVRGVGFVLESR